MYGISPVLPEMDIQWRLFLTFFFLLICTIYVCRVVLTPEADEKKGKGIIYHGEMILLK